MFWNYKFLFIDNKRNYAMIGKKIKKIKNKIELACYICVVSTLIYFSFLMKTSRKEHQNDK